MNDNYDINQAIQMIAQMKNAGKNPQQFLQMAIQQNPNIRQSMVTMQNMSQGKNPQEFLIQLAKQNGANEQSINTIKSMFNKNN